MSDTTTTTAAPSVATKSLKELLALPAGTLTPYMLVRVLENATYALPEAATKAKMDPRQLRALCRENKIPGAVKLQNDVWLLPRKEFDAWLGVRSDKRATQVALEAQLAQLQAKMDELKQSKSSNG